MWQTLAGACVEVQTTVPSLSTGRVPVAKQELPDVGCGCTCMAPSRCPGVVRSTLCYKPQVSCKRRRRSKSKLIVML